MKMRDKILYMSYGAGLVVLGMVLNSLIVDANAGKGSIDAKFGEVICRKLIIKDGDETRGAFGLSSGSAQLGIFGDDEQSTVAYLGEDGLSGEMRFSLYSKSKTDKRKVSMQINEFGGRFDSFNKMGENVVRIAVADDGGGGLDLRNKHGYRK